LTNKTWIQKGNNFPNLQKNENQTCGEHFRICILQHPDLSRPLASRRELGHKEAEPQLFQSLDPNGQESCANGKNRGNNNKENKENNKKTNCITGLSCRVLLLSSLV